MTAHLQNAGYIIVLKHTLRISSGALKNNIGAELVKGFSNARLLLPVA